MKFRTLHVSAFFCFLAAGFMAWWMLTQSGQSDMDTPQRVRAVAMSPPPSPVVREKFVEPDLPQNDGRVPLTDPAADLQNKVAAAVVMNLKFQNAPLSEVIDELYRQCEINFILRTGETGGLTMNFDEAPLREVLHVIEEMTGCEFDLQGNSAVLLPPGASPQMTTAVFRLPEEAGTGVTNSQSARKFLVEAGIRMPDGASASWEPRSRRMIVRTCIGELKRVVRLVETGDPDPLFEWHPVTFDEREYVSANEVRRFYEFCSAMPGEGAMVFQSKPPGGLSEPWRMEWRAGDRVIRISGIRYMLHRPALENQRGFWISRADLAWTLEPVLRPVRVAKAPRLTTAVIDVAAARKGEEPDPPVSAAHDVAALLQQKLEAAGWIVLTTNDDGREPSPAARMALANRHTEAVLVSLRARASGSSGIETHLPNPAGIASGNLRAQGVALATAVHSSCIRRLGGNDGAVRSAGMDILEGLLIPGVLVQIPHPAGRAEAVAEDRAEIAKAIAEGLDKYRQVSGRKPKADAPAGVSR